MERFGGYRVHVSQQRIQQWLNQFENGHRDLGARILDAVESSDRMLHTFRAANGLNAERFDNLFIHKSELLRQNLGAADTVVFVDDFAGTGEQAVTAWKESLGELLPGRPRIFLVLAVAI